MDKQYRLWVYDRQHRTLRMLMWKMLPGAQVPAVWNTRTAAQAYGNKHHYPRHGFKVLECEGSPVCGMEHEKGRDKP